MSVNGHHQITSDSYANQIYIMQIDNMNVSFIYLAGVLVNISQRSSRDHLRFLC